MSFTLGVFDLFAYAVPGSLYLAVTAYVAVRLGYVDVASIHNVPALLLYVGLAVASYVVGHCTYNLGTIADRLSPLWRTGAHRFKDDFVRMVPQARDRPYIQMDHRLLMAAADLHNREVASEIARLRAVGLMLRNAVVPLMLATVTAFIEALAGAHRVAAACACFVLALLVAGCMVQTFVMRRWANIRTLELCYWIPDIDEKAAGPASRPA